MLHTGWIVWTAAGLFFMLLIVAASSEIVFTSQFLRKSDNDHFVVRIHALYGMINYKLEIPLFRFKEGNIEFLQEKRNSYMIGENKNKGEHKVGVETVMRKLDEARTLLRYTDHFTVWLRKTLSHVRIASWEWNTTVGAGDAVWTAMTTGMLWSAQTALLGVLSQFMRLTVEPQTRVQPLYNQTYFSTEWSCIAKMSFGYAILAGLKLLVRIKKVKGGFTVWQNILFKA
ncbi:DUF2953 domain-containing protein [Paenibacillus sp. GCM10012307]|uniref:DUF2953 domain-containing protein n=1 Tax=Paenibacillus roseus TaxID=2798579 RepID=A0A934MQS4_9BACL|nr:DUF2953 domain-containing protein [Paenibacillus roseus]MBJ6363476.1 DUF2953 domain-containing protein [Paenibacillus roseus]